ncbi:MAG: 30S ribosomal protein S12 methylthiotransferase RimO [Lachnospiraceae bacterium]|nr:30S ribosomal protein S12 methylthiotransferase RimO [Lachnospiraceae bacterium]
MPSVFLLSLGCDKNLTDSEKLLHELAAAGFTLTDDPAEADHAVVNTCCFTEEAKKESIEEIMELSRIKEGGRLKTIIVAGCMAERYIDTLAEIMPEADRVVPLSSFFDIPDILAGGNSDRASGLTAGGREHISRVITTGGVYEYLKIADGCNRNCTYCAIPLIRGRYRSYPEEQLLAEARGLAIRGVKELILVAQETSLYGIDLYGEKRLPELVRKLCGIDGIEHIRLLYVYPESVDDELIDLIRTEDKVLNYLDLPVQHGSDRILKLMGRHTDRASIHGVIDRLRTAVPGIALRTSLITGFPGETEEDHEILMDFVRTERFDRLGVFIYSREEGTKAYSMPGQVHWKTKERRRNALMELQQGIAFEKAHSLTGQEMKVMVDGFLPEENVYACRSYRDAPDVDGLVFLKADREMMSGTLVNCRITGSAGYDLEAEEI